MLRWSCRFEIKPLNCALMRLGGGARWSLMCADRFTCAFYTRRGTRGGNSEVTRARAHTHTTQRWDYYYLFSHLFIYECLWTCFGVNPHHTCCSRAQQWWNQHLLRPRARFFFRALSASATQASRLARWPLECKKTNQMQISVNSWSDASAFIICV